MPYLRLTVGGGGRLLSYALVKDIVKSQFFGASILWYEALAVYFTGALCVILVDFWTPDRSVCEPEAI